RFIKDFPGYIFYVGENKRGQLQKIIVYALKDETNVVMTVKAARGKMEVDAPNRVINLHLYDAKTLTVREGRVDPGAQEEWSLQLDLKAPEKQTHTAALSDLTFTQLWDELHDLERGRNLPMPAGSLTRDEARKQRVALFMERLEPTER